MGLRNPDCKDCTLCQEANTVCIGGEGPVPCDIMVVAEAPGFTEDEKGRVLIGKTGKTTNELLLEAGLARDQVYLTNAVKCHPPDNRTPSRAEIMACQKYLLREIEMVKPKVIVILGAVAYLSVLGKKGISKDRGSIITERGIDHLITLHPAALFRNPQQEPYVRADFKLLGRLIREGNDSSELDFTIVRSMNDFRACIADLSKQRVCSYDIESSGLYPFIDPSLVFVLGIARPGKQWIIPMAYPGSPFRTRDSQQKAIEVVKYTLKDTKMIGQNGKFDNKWLRTKYGWRPNLKFDTMLASHLLDENIRHDLEELASLFYNAPNYKIKMPVNPLTTPLEKTAKHNAYDVYYTLKLYDDLGDQLIEDPQLLTIYKKLIMPAVEAVEDAEMEGVYIDPELYPKALEFSDGEVKEYLQKLNGLTGKELNWNSTKQVGQFLFQELNLPVIEKTDGGDPSTGESVLLRLRDKHPAVEALLAYRSKLKLNQFLHQWKEFMVNNRMHPTFRLHGTVTGRLSCKNPNLQQVPRDTFLRSLITAPPGWAFVEADYSQVELRITAQVSGDRTMKLAYQTGEDLHRKTAAAVMGKLPEEVSKDERKAAKAVNFGFIYGMQATKFATYARDKYEVILSDEQSLEFRSRFFELYSGLSSWHERQRKLARKFKYVRTLMGRKRRLPGVDSDNRFERSEAERQAINSPVQGLASDIALFSFGRLHREMPKDIFKIVGGVHDAILFMVKEEFIDEIIPRVRQIMIDTETINKTFNCNITVPLEVEIKVGPWGKGKVYEKDLKEAC